MKSTQLGIAAAAAVAVFAWAAPAAHADTVTLKNGREIHGRLVEERLDSIRIRTSGGTITISKAEVATFSENMNLGDYDLKDETKRRLEEEAREAEEGEKGEGEGGAKGEGEGGASSGAGSEKKPTSLAALKAGWTWGKDLDKDQIAKLTSKRDDLFKKLEAMGPSPEERLEALKLSSNEVQDVRARIEAFASVRRRGSANQRRQAAMNELLDKYGARAVEVLATSLGSSNGWVRRTCAQALAALTGRGDEKARAESTWAINHFGVPEKLMSMLDSQGETDSGAIRQDAHEALTSITGAKVSYKSSEQPLRDGAETAGYKAWQAWWKNNRGNWDRLERDRAKEREQVLAELEDVRVGKGLSGGSNDQDDEL